MALAYQKPIDEIAGDFLNIMKKSENIKRQEPLAEHTTFRIGGPADFFLTPEDEEEVKALITYCKQRQIPYFFLGNGSNLLVSDGGYRGVIISLKHFREISASGEIMTAGAGALLSSLSSKAAQYALAGLEFAAGIPGTIGGAVMMNAGAYGGEIRQVLKSARILCEDGTIREFSNQELSFGYRYSCLKENHGIVLSAEFALQKGNREEIRAKMADYNARRREKQPLEYPSAGSTFQRPEGYFAGKLIEEAGLKGYHVGGMEVSRKHSGFVINKGNGTAQEARELIADVQDIVLEKFGVRLEPEIRFLGFTEELW